MTAAEAVEVAPASGGDRRNHARGSLLKLAGLSSVVLSSFLMLGCKPTSEPSIDPREAAIQCSSGETLATFLGAQNVNDLSESVRSKIQEGLEEGFLKAARIELYETWLDAGRRGDVILVNDQVEQDAFEYNMNLLVDSIDFEHIKGWNQLTPNQKKRCFLGLFLMLIWCVSP